MTRPNSFEFGVIACGLIGVSASAWYALGPSEIQIADDSGLAQSASPTRHTMADPDVSKARLDLASFDATLWYTPPPIIAEPSAPPPPPPEPLRHQLLAILESVDPESGLRATLHDPQTGELVIVGPGDPIGAYSVELLTNNGVRFMSSRGARELLLDPNKPLLTEESP